ncbi:hypothetical protein GY45DRAFT_992662 [Cubamyces sp. BRFM 1775]|nr:hypothetical protein GY45DRAFT_992662 [Cubamyces sp. BRFM 1775]
MNEPLTDSDGAQHRATQYMSFKHFKAPGCRQLLNEVKLRPIQSYTIALNGLAALPSDARADQEPLSRSGGLRNQRTQWTLCEIRWPTCNFPVASPLRCVNEPLLAPATRVSPLKGPSPADHDSRGLERSADRLGGYLMRAARLGRLAGMVHMIHQRYYRALRDA